MNTTKPLTIFDRVIPSSVKNAITLTTSRRKYGQLRFILLSAMLSIALGPLLMMAGLGYYYYKDLLQNSEREQLEWQLDGSIKSIQHMVDSLKSVVQFAGHRGRYNELITGNNLEHLLIRIQRQYGFFADLGVVDQSGIQQAYFGPYDLAGADYSQEEWFKEVFERGVYISRVYTGYRQIPHFAVAVSNIDPASRKVWVLRATIDATSLQQLINTIKTNAAHDVFLVDNTGKLQTSSGLFGATLSQFSSEIVEGIRHDISADGENIFQAVGNIENTPWSLVIIKKKYIHQNDWKDFKGKLYLMLFGCILTGVLVVYSLVKVIIGLIRKTDDMQLAMLQEAEHTDKLASIGRLAAGVGHEINNPLAIISQKAGLIEDLLLLSDEFNHKKVIQDNLVGIYKSVDRCKAITHRLLGFARRNDVHSEQMQINEVITEVLQFLENAMVYNRISLNLQLQEVMPDVTSDRLQLQQAFLNILNNAIDAIGKDGEITITTYLVAGDVRVVMQDNGPGIDPAVLPNIFEPFYTTKELGKGTGLGLSITYGLIKKLGGDITVRSQPGVGTAFTITIPQHGNTHDSK
ncbi:PAS domain-containing sensor histidine kinase [Desulfosediminicola flagellatus]|uniref:sensor histidine kinase n=1 Tax=Desulfosediminicola flagellatus TaxID=2569541 RepID=UPI0010AC50CA|nr:PAS domain-containing sensor histidine kinase [Desulfosediminicola flagellatus]